MEIPVQNVKITPLLDTLKMEDIDDDVYFSKKFKNYISNSRLGILKSKGAKVFFEGIPQTYNPSFETGTLIHENVLEPEKYEVIDKVFKPSAKAGLMADALYKSDGTIPTDDEIKSQSYVIGYYKDKLTTNRLNEFRQKAEPYWRDRFVFEQANPKSDKIRIYTDIKNYELLNNCLNSLNNDSSIQELLHPTGIVEDPIVKNEHTILLDVKMEIPDVGEGIYKLKAKLDNFSIDTEGNVVTVNDLKTSSKPVSMFDPAYFSYQREIAFYSFLLRLCAKKYYNLDKPKVKGNFLVVSTVPDYNTCVYPMTQDLFISGWNEAIYLLKSVCYLNLVKGYEFK